MHRSDYSRARRIIRHHRRDQILPVLAILVGGEGRVEQQDKARIAILCVYLRIGHLRRDGVGILVDGPVLESGFDGPRMIGVLICSWKSNRHYPLILTSREVRLAKQDRKGRVQDVAARRCREESIVTLRSKRKHAVENPNLSIVCKAAGLVERQ